MSYFYHPPISDITSGACWEITSLPYLPLDWVGPFPTQEACVIAVLDEIGKAIKNLERMATQIQDYSKGCDHV